MRERSYPVREALPQSRESFFSLMINNFILDKLNDRGQTK